MAGKCAASLFLTRHSLLIIAATVVTSLHALASHPSKNVDHSFEEVRETKNLAKDNVKISHSKFREFIAYKDVQMIQDSDGSSLRVGIYYMVKRSTSDVFRSKEFVKPSEVKPSDADSRGTPFHIVDGSRIVRTQQPPMPMPNIDKLGSAYDIIYANPHALGSIDPGFREPVYNLSVYSGKLTPDQRFAVPDGTQVSVGRTCALSFCSSEVLGGSSYCNSLKASIKVIRI